MSNGGNHRRLEQSAMRGGVARMRGRERMSASVSERERRENVVSLFVSMSVSTGRNHRRLEQECDATRRNSTPYLLYIHIYIYIYIYTYIYIYIYIHIYISV